MPDARQRIAGRYKEKPGAELLTVPVVNTNAVSKMVLVLITVAAPAAATALVSVTVGVTLSVDVVVLEAASESLTVADWFARLRR